MLSPNGDVVGAFGLSTIGIRVLPLGDSSYLLKILIIPNFVCKSPKRAPGSNARYYEICQDKESSFLNKDSTVAITPIPYVSFPLSMIETSRYRSSKFPSCDKTTRITVSTKRVNFFCLNLQRFPYLCICAGLPRTGSSCTAVYWTCFPR